MAAVVAVDSFEKCCLFLCFVTRLADLIPDCSSLIVVFDINDDLGEDDTYRVLMNVQWQ